MGQSVRLDSLQSGSVRLDSFTPRIIRKIIWPEKIPHPSDDILAGRILPERRITAEDRVTDDAMTAMRSISPVMVRPGMEATWLKQNNPKVLDAIQKQAKVRYDNAMQSDAMAFDRTIAAQQPTMAESFLSGIDALQAQTQRGAALVAEKIGFADTSKSLLAAAQANALKAQSGAYKSKYGDVGLAQIKNLSSPDWWKATIAEAIPSSAPFFAGAITGAVATPPVLPLVGPFAKLLGAAVGGGAAVYMQEVGPAYYEYLKTKPGDTEGAADYAFKKAGLTGVINAASVPAAMLGIGAGVVKHMLLQMALQGGIGGADTVVGNVVRRDIDPRQPISEGVAKSVVGEAAFEAPALVFGARTLIKRPPIAPVPPAPLFVPPAPPTAPPASQPVDARIRGLTSDRQRFQDLNLPRHVAVVEQQISRLATQPVRLDSIQPVELPKLTEAPAVDNQVRDLQIVNLPLANLTLSKDVPQFKGGADEKGIVTPLGGAFDPTGVGPIQVWERTDGRMEIISGRHRFDLARRSGRVAIAAQVHREADGFTADQAASLDAILNIRDEQGSVADYAQYFKTSNISEDAAKAGGLLARAKGRTGFSISRDASPDVIAAHRAGIISDDAAVGIAQAAPNDTRLQSLGLKFIQDGKNITNTVNMIHAVKVLANESGDGNLDMFGFDDSAMKEAEQMAKIASSKQRAISDRLSAMQGAAKRPEVARQEGIDIKDVNAVNNRIVELKTQKDAWTRWSTSPDLIAEIRAEINGEVRPSQQAVGESAVESVAAPAPIPPVPPADLLTSYTNKDVIDRMDRLEQNIKDASEQNAKDLAAATKDADRKNIAQRSIGAAATFELDGDALQNLSGQETLFSVTPTPDITPSLFSETPTGTTLYSGLPIEHISAMFTSATDSLGLPEKGVVLPETKTPEATGITRALRSPKTVAEKYPEFAPFKILQDRAKLVNDTLVDAFGRRFHFIDKTLGAGLQRVKDFGSEYRANKADYHDIQMAEDVLERHFTVDELKAKGYNSRVINAVIQRHALMNRLLGTMNHYRASVGKDPITMKGGYTAHIFHDFFLKVNGKIEGSAETMAEAVSMANKAQRKGFQVEIVAKGFEFKDAGQSAQAIGDKQYFIMKQNLEKMFTFTPDEIAEIMEGAVKLKARSRFFGNALERKGVSGWDKNLDWVDRHYASMSARYVAIDKFKRDAIGKFQHKWGSFDNEHSGIAQYTKNYINRVLGSPTRADKIFQDLLDKTPLLGKFTEYHLGKNAAQKISQSTVQAVNVTQLGLFTMAYPLVNAHDLLKTYAILGEKWFGVGVVRMSRLSTVQGIRKLGFDTDALADLGILRQLDIEIGQGITGADRGKGTISQVAHATLMLGRGVEYYIRGVAGLGAYHKGIKEDMSKKDALAYARDVNTRANIDYSVGNTPSLIAESGPVGQLLLQYKKYIVGSYEGIASFSAMSHIRYWVPLLLLAGLFQIPGSDALLKLIKWATSSAGGPGYDTELEIKREFAKWAVADKEKQEMVNTANYGLWSKTGADVSERIGLSGAIPSQPSDLLGPAIGTISRAGGLFVRGEIEKGLMSLTATTRSYYAAKEGEITTTRDRLVKELTPNEKIIRGIGFNPVGVSIERDITRMLNYTKQQEIFAKKQAIDKFIKLLDNIVNAKSESQLEDIREKASIAYEKASMLGVTKEQISNEIKKKGMSASQRAFFGNLSKRQKAENVDVMQYGQQ